MDTITRAIEPENWAAYLASLSKRMRERSVELRVESLDLGDQRIAWMPLVGISTEDKESTHPAIELTLGKGTATMLTHVVQHPTRVQVKEDHGTVTCLEIEDQDQSKTLLTF